MYYEHEIRFAGRWYRFYMKRESMLDISHGHYGSKIRINLGGVDIFGKVTNEETNEEYLVPFTEANEANGIIYIPWHQVEYYMVTPTSLELKPEETEEEKPENETPEWINKMKEAGIDTSKVEDK